jgi:hypothetical protein
MSTAKMNNNLKTLADYLHMQANKLNISESKLSKLIAPGSTGALIATIRHAEHKVSEEKVCKIAKYFNEDSNILTFLVKRIPKEIQEMIVNDKELQKYLIRKLKEKND